MSIWTLNTTYVFGCYELEGDNSHIERRYLGFHKRISILPTGSQNKMFQSLPYEDSWENLLSGSRTSPAACE